MTRSPTANLVTPDPRADTTPASSCPSTWGRTTSVSCPIQACQSLRHRPVAFTSITTPLAEGVGFGTSLTDSSPPNSEKWIARMAKGYWVDVMKVKMTEF